MAAFSGLLRLLEGGTVWLKLSAPYRLGAGVHPYPDLQRVVATLFADRPDRLLWATDWPHTELWSHMPDDLELIEALSFREMPAHLRTQVLVDNPAHLYGFAPRHISARPHGAPSRLFEQASMSREWRVCPFRPVRRPSLRSGPPPLARFRRP